MTNPAMAGLLGYGPSLVDYRSGELLSAQMGRAARRKAARVSLYAACCLATVSAQAPRLSLRRGYR